MRTYYVPGIDLVARNLAETKTEKVHALMDLIFIFQEKGNK